MAEITVTDDLSLRAEEFANKYHRTPNFIQRYNVWTSYLDRYVRNVSFAYDMGCGPGIFSFYLASKGVETEGWDGAEGMIRLCNEKKAADNIFNTSFKKQILPVRNTANLRKAGLVISSSVIEYIDDAEGTIRMFNELLLPGGIVLVSFPNRSAWYRKLEELSFRLIKKPAYYRFVRNKWKLGPAKDIFERNGFKYLEHSYYADRSIAGKAARFLAGPAQAGSLLIVAFKKV